MHRDNIGNHAGLISHTFDETRFHIGALNSDLDVVNEKVNETVWIRPKRPRYIPTAVPHIVDSGRHDKPHSGRLGDGEADLYVPANTQAGGITDRLDSELAQLPHISDRGLQVLVDIECMGPLQAKGFL